jgi:hypothetical protein
MPALIWADEKPVILPTQRDLEHRGAQIYYDKKYIWQFNEYENKEKLPVVSLDERSIETFPLCHPQSGVIHPPRMNVEKLIMFGYDEGVIDTLNPLSVKIYDKYGVNMSKEMSFGDNRVIGVYYE